MLALCRSEPSPKRQHRKWLRRGYASTPRVGRFSDPSIVTGLPSALLPQGATSANAIELADNSQAGSRATARYRWHTGCTSWYIDENGNDPKPWPWTWTWSTYRRRTSRLAPGAYELAESPRASAQTISTDAAYRAFSFGPTTSPTSSPRPGSPLATNRQRPMSSTLSSGLMSERDDAMEAGADIEAGPGTSRVSELDASNVWYTRLFGRPRTVASATRCLGDGRARLALHRQRAKARAYRRRKARRPTSS